MIQVDEKLDVVLPDHTLLGARGGGSQGLNGDVTGDTRWRSFPSRCVSEILTYLHTYIPVPRWLSSQNG